MPVLEAEGRLELLGVEGHRRVLESRLHLGEHLERLEVGRDHDARPAVEEDLEERGPQRGALGGVGSGAQLVEEDERSRPGHREDLPHLADERGEGREVLGEALLVPDHRQHPIRKRDPAAGRCGHVAPRLGHEDQKAAGLERDRLAARVRAAQDQPRPVSGHPEVHGDDVAHSGR